MKPNYSSIIRRGCFWSCWNQLIDKNDSSPTLKKMADKAQTNMSNLLDTFLGF